MGERGRVVETNPPREIRVLMLAEGSPLKLRPKCGPLPPTPDEGSRAHLKENRATGIPVPKTPSSLTAPGVWRGLGGGVGGGHHPLLPSRGAANAAALFIRAEPDGRAAERFDTPGVIRERPHGDFPA